MKEVLLFSGGLDSLIAWYYLGRPRALYVDIGHRYSLQEKKAIKRIANKTGMKVIVDQRLNLGDKEHQDAYIPMRNSFLAHVAALYGEKIWMVVQKGELTLADRSPEFFKDLTKMLQHLNSNPNIQVDSPFWDMTKVDMVRWYVNQGLPLDVLLSSMSCYNGTNCGACPACFRRWVALELNGIEEKYQNDPWTTSMAKIYLEKIRHGEYPPERSEDILMALAKRGVTDAEELI